MPRVFISYRRIDTGQIAGRVAERLEMVFGRDNIFLDVDRLLPGVEFPNALSQTLANCDVLVVLVGDRWLESSTGGRPRLFSEGDWVRLEIEAALKRGIPIIPLLINPVSMPPENSLPGPLSRFTRFQAAKLDVGPDFNHHIERLITQIKRLLGTPEKVPTQGEVTKTTEGFPVELENDLDAAESYESIGDVWSAASRYESLAEKLESMGNRQLAGEMKRRAKLNRRAAAQMMRGD
jgi:hypothetical protein